MPDIDWTGVSDEQMEQMLAQADTYLSAMLDVATASDQRATSLGSLCGGAGVALLAAAATIIAGSTPRDPLVLGAVVTALGFFVAAYLYASASEPVDFYLAGFEPAPLASAPSEKTARLRVMLEDMQARIVLNRVTIDRAAGLTKWGRRAAVAGVAVGSVVFLLAQDLALTWPL